MCSLCCTSVCAVSSITLHFNYAQNSSEVCRECFGNAAEVERLDKFLQEAFSDTTAIDFIRLDGYCSVEGSAAYNETLARQRVEGLRRFLDKEYNLSERFRVRAVGHGADWAGLRRLLIASTGTVYGAADLVRVIDLVPLSDGRMGEMQRIMGGIPYRQTERTIYPQLRRVEITVVHEGEADPCGCPDTDHYAAAGQPCQPCMPVQPCQPVQPCIPYVPYTPYAPYPAAAYQQPAPRVKAQHDGFFRPYVGIKTNLAQIAGFMPDGKFYTPTPNIELEVYLLPWLSIEGKALYANWDFGRRRNDWLDDRGNQAYDNKRHGVSAYSGEVRFWPWNDGRHRWAYVGLYGQSGDFTNCNWADDRVADGMKSCTGTYWSAGLTAGCYLPINAHWGFEAGVRLGYQRSKNFTFVRVPQDAAACRDDITYDHWHVDPDPQPTHPHKIGITETRLALVYRIGKWMK